MGDLVAESLSGELIQLSLDNLFVTFGIFLSFFPHQGSAPKVSFPFTGDSNPGSLLLSSINFLFQSPPTFFLVPNLYVSLKKTRETSSNLQNRQNKACH